MIKSLLVFEPAAPANRRTGSDPGSPAFNRSLVCMFLWASLHSRCIQHKQVQCKRLLFIMSTYILEPMHIISVCEGMLAKYSRMSRNKPSPECMYKIVPACRCLHPWQPLLLWPWASYGASWVLHCCSQLIPWKTRLQSKPEALLSAARRNINRLYVTV